jgi:hypothetical protein
MLNTKQTKKVRLAVDFVFLPDDDLVLLFADNLQEFRRDKNRKISIQVPDLQLKCWCKYSEVNKQAELGI